MSDTAKSWIEERQAIHAAATEGPWVAEYSGETGDCVIPHDAQSTREAVAVTRLFHRTADANAIADAHNMFPRALDALNAVLELHKAEMLYENVGRCENYNEYHVDDFHTESEDGVEICMGMPTGTRVCRSCRVADEPVDWPCATVQAIEGAING